MRKIGLLLSALYTSVAQKSKFVTYRSVPYIFAISFFTLAFISANATISIDNLQVEYTTTPIGIDVAAPRFSWQMTASSNEKNIEQTFYRIEVKNTNGKMVWNSKKIADNKSIGILYDGIALTSATRYFWTVTVWCSKGAVKTSTSFFETGLMNGDKGLAAWDGAAWIGGNKEDMVLHAQYLPLFKLDYTLAIVEGSKNASIIFGANDARLMDKNKNSFLLSNLKNESYFKIELDITEVNAKESGMAKLNIYRAGYSNTDTANKILKSFLIKSSFLNNSNKNSPHHFTLKDEYGEITIKMEDSIFFYLDNPVTKTEGEYTGFGGTKKGAIINLNPLGKGHDYISFGMLCDIGFFVNAGQQAVFSKLSVSNTRNPENIIFKEDLTLPHYQGIYKDYLSNANVNLIIKNGAYHIVGGSSGAFIVADPSRNAMPMLRTSFSAENKKINSARLYVTARGIYEMYLNGKRVGADYYNPGFTQYNVTHFYQTYDVTNMVNTGQNAMGAMLGEGWWSGLLSFGAIWNHFGDRQSLLAKLVITYNDGSQKIVTTNNKEWKYYNHGPIVYSSLDMGEVYDASREAAIKDWSTTAYNDKDWHSTETIVLDGTVYQTGAVDYAGHKQDINYDNLKITGQIGENAGIYKTITANSFKEVRKGVFVYNMGQNIVGVPKIKILNGKAGQLLTIRVAEVLYPDLKESGTSVGMLMTENYRAALSQDTYTMKDGEQIFQPHFTSHGYQYIELTGIDEALPIADVQALSISSIKKLTANYETSNAKVNKLWSNLVWSNVDNFLTIPTDCPQRNERMGWSGDISIFSRTATYLSNTSQFLRRHMVAMRNVQSQSGRFTDIAPVGGGFGGLLWGSAGITVAWEAYQQYNDIGLLKEHYAAMVDYINYLDANINKQTGLCTDAQLGDWLGPQNRKLGTDFLVTAYHIFDLEIMNKIAAVLNKKDDAAKFLDRYKERKTFFNKTFVNADKKTLGLIGGGFPFYADAPNQIPVFKLADTQTSYAVGLALGVFNEEYIPFMIKNLKESVERENTDDQGEVRPKFSLMTGFIGTAWISKALSDNGNGKLAYKILQNNQYPSWLYAVDQGATTIWERLNGYTLDKGFGGNNSMNSFNHYSFGAIGQWMMSNSLGIQRNEPGFKKFILQPEIDETGEMKWAKGYYDSPYGRISSSWKMENGIFIYNATVPANTSATLYLPAKDSKSIKENGKVIDAGKGILFLGYKKGKAIYELKSGSYQFSAKQ